MAVIAQVIGEFYGSAPARTRPSTARVEQVGPGRYLVAC